MDAPVVLMVGPDAEDRDRYGAWLEDDGIEVVTCPGPSAPDYTCVGGRTGTCPLAKQADVVILDSALPGDVLGEGTANQDLVTLYTSLGKPVIGVATLARDVPPPAGWLRWPPNAKALLKAVRERMQPAG